ncbi:glycosyltransferase [Paenibacillus nasutitermitis]|uniref:Glycosyltransferase 2-like domain-containing protein n=1 Tax=Paenibacillus nasutitermitis TaxID=1652958 RepID=A0A916ZDA4_9BACL|nr:glycosyltransferase [Paenibacillus nasutitermitis]GGD89555.1 hypothetical protein GCM10010911_55190 [Paenibacillus nasutitermitis]
MKVSIIVMARHVSELKQCIASIELYTPSPFELVVVNGGADRDVAQWLEKRSHLQVVAADPKGSATRGFNLGAAQTSGDLLVFIQDHVLVAEHWLKCLAGCLDNHPEAAMVGPISNHGRGRQRLSLQCETIQQFDTMARAYVTSHAGEAVPVISLYTHLLVVRRDVFRQLGGFDEQLGLLSQEEDYDFCYRAFEAGHVLYVAQDCYVRCLEPPERVSGNEKQSATERQMDQARLMGKWGFDITAELMRWEQPVTVSLCMIVRNEEQSLGRCLSSIGKLVDEIIIVDTGSADQTIEIAKEYTEHVYDFPWVNDFSKARNYAFSLASKEYILWLDADDVLLPRDAEAFSKLVGTLGRDTDAVSMPYHLGFDTDGNVTASLRRNRLVKRERSFRWIGAVHEYLEVDGKIAESDIAVTHDRKHSDSSRNLHIYEQREEKGELFNARDLYYYANELADHDLHERAILKYEQFLQHPEGVRENKINACGRAGDALHALGRTDEAKKKVMQSFAYSLPRAENCCRLGFYHIAEENFEEAIVWYKQATQLPKPTDPGALLLHASWTWLPHLQLCVCYDRLGQPELARGHNEIAAGYVPNNSRILANRQYFASLNLSGTAAD